MESSTSSDMLKCFLYYPRANCAYRCLKSLFRLFLLENKCNSFIVVDAGGVFASGQIFRILKPFRMVCCSYISRKNTIIKKSKIKEIPWLIGTGWPCYNTVMRSSLLNTCSGFWFFSKASKSRPFVRKTRRRVLTQIRPSF